jgi:hypothetical protein
MRAMTESSAIAPRELPRKPGLVGGMAVVVGGIGTQRPE